jgi:hypothetical protein
LRDDLPGVTLGRLLQEDLEWAMKIFLNKEEKQEA